MDRRAGVRVSGGGNGESSGARCTERARMSVPDVPLSERVTLTVLECAALLGIGERVVWELVGRGDLFSVKVKGRRLVPRSALDAYISALITGTGTGKGSAA